MKVLVTGGAGYIGSHTCKALAAAGHEPVVFDDLSMGHRWAVRWGPLEIGRIDDPVRLAEVFRRHSIEAVIHFAASAYVGESMADPMKYFMNNTVGTTSLLDAMVRNGVSRIVFSSTCATYGIPQRVPIDETFPTNPVNPYGETKLTIERTLRWLGEIKGVRWVALRYFNAAGADPDAEIGEVHDPETHLIPLVLRAAAPGDFSLQVFGADYPTPDGTAIRDYIHVLDLASAHVLALEGVAAEPVNDVFNLGTGNGASVRDVIAAAERVTGAKVRHSFAPRRPGDPPSLVARAEKMHARFGWAPVRSDLDTLVADAWRWARTLTAEHHTR